MYRDYIIYVNENFNLDLYTLLYFLGMIVALILLRVLFDKKQVDYRVQNFYLFVSTLTLIASVFSSVLFQSFFDYLKYGTFELSGMTFYGGFIGGITVFFLSYYLIGKLVFKNGEHKKVFKTVESIAPICICFGHSIGRIGCLMAGCCYGKKSNYGIYMTTEEGYGKFLPTQLYEAIFLFVLGIILFIRFNKDKKYNLSIYLIGYGIWRFFIEFLRGDDRGSFFVPFLSPAQCIAVILVSVGVITVLLQTGKFKNTNKIKT